MDIDYSRCCCPVIRANRCIYSFIFTNLFGSSVPLPAACVIGYFVGTIISAVFMFFAVRIDGKKRINQFRWIIFFVILWFIGQAWIISLILIYAMHQQTQVIYTFWASINCLGFLPYSLLLFYISRSYVIVAQPEAVTNQKYTAPGWR